MKLSEKEKVNLIRRGNQFFNEGKIDLAEKIFVATNYIDGLIRLGDYYYKKSQPLKALTYYKKANFTPRIEEISRLMFEALKVWLKEEENE